MKQEETRRYWLDIMLKIASPVLDKLSQRRLRADMPVEQLEGVDRTPYAHLEAFGRTICGLAPWLEAEGLDEEEAALQAETLKKVYLCLDAATDPESPDRLNFSGVPQAQPLVDAAFLAHGILRAPRVLADELDERIKKNLIACLKETRNTIPNPSNWLLFSAMVEAGLCRLGDKDYDMVRIQYAIRQFLQWYKGDGMYGDGEPFHMDYYNSFVIQPMIVDIVRLYQQYPNDRLFGSEDSVRFHADKLLARAARYASVLERMIAPDGSYPIVGRSITYRFGAFQSLAQAAQEHFLEAPLTPAMARCALTAVIERIMSAPGNFDENGWLTLGVYGHQPHLAEPYLCTGSMYLCSTVFLPLGLAPSDPFWSEPNTLYTNQIALSGADMMLDHSMAD